GLDLPLPRTMQLDLDLPDVLEVEKGPSSFVLAHLAPVAVGGEADALEPAPPFEAGVARRLARLDAAEERLEGEVELAEGGLCRGEVEPGVEVVLAAGLLEGSALLPVAD